MRKKTIVRFQLVALFLITGLVLFQVFSGPPAPSGTITINKIKPSSLEKVTFQLDRPVTFLVKAAGSHPSVDNQAELAVYAWILDSASRNPVWKMQDAQLRSDNTLATTEDTLQLQTGIYEAYFTSFGNQSDSGSHRRILGVRIGEKWVGDSEKWHLVLDAIPEEDESAVTVVDDPATESPGEIWTTGPVSSPGTQQFVFEVSSDLTLNVRAIGEYCEPSCDFGAIVDYVDGDTIWYQNLLNSFPAGGMQGNIVFDGSVELVPGTYRAFYETDYRHSFNRWEANPPFDPSGWGMTLSVAEEDRDEIKAFDPWTQREPIISMVEIGSNQQEKVSFQVHDSVTVLAYAVGELTRSGSSYDYASIKDVSTGERVWVMSYSASEPAGGYKNNRKEIAVVPLVPGRYELTYQTDSSHDFDAFSNGEPDYPSRWGVTLFPFDTAYNDSMITVKGPVRATPVPYTVDDTDLDAAQVIVNATQLGNNEQIVQAFELKNLTIIRIVAVGEISTSGQYDYGWIEETDSGTVIWEMTRRNTIHAGGDDHNRKFEGLVELQPGSYRVHFKTDFTHAFGDFGDGGPDNPSDWGIRIEKILSSD